MLATSACVCLKNMYTGCDRARQRNEYLESSGGVWISYLLSDEVREPLSVFGKGAEVLFSCSRRVSVSSTQSLCNSGGIPRVYSFKGLNLFFPAAEVESCWLGKWGVAR